MAKTSVAAALMKSVQVPKVGGEFEIVERDLPEPGARQVRIKVNACGVCHSDSFTVEGTWPGIQYPRVPGHEVVGVIDGAGAGVAGWKIGKRGGGGWDGGRAQVWRAGRLDSGSVSAGTAATTTPVCNVAAETLRSHVAGRDP